jgi:hypothetical protein
MVALVKGVGHDDVVCAGNISALPQMDLVWTADEAERFFSSGNERTPASFDKAGKFGFHLAAADEIGFIIDLMNENMQSHDVYMTMTWEYLSDKVPGFTWLKPVWLDVTTCGLSDVEAPKGKSVFTLESPKWVNKKLDGALVGMGTHVHDGGISVEVFQNSKPICTSISKYGQTAAYRSPPIQMENATLAKLMSAANVHISEQSICYNAGTTKKGDEFTIQGKYDFNKYKPMINDDAEPSDVMTIAIMFIALPQHT